MKPHEVDMAEECQSFRDSLLRLIEALSLAGPFDYPHSHPLRADPLAGEPCTVPVRTRSGLTLRSVGTQPMPDRRG